MAAVDLLERIGDLAHACPSPRCIDRQRNEVSGVRFCRVSERIQCPAAGQIVLGRLLLGEDDRETGAPVVGAVVTMI